MNKVFKTIIVISLALMVIAAGVIGFIFYKLPSVGSLSKIVRPSGKMKPNDPTGEKPIEVVEGTPNPTVKDNLSAGAGEASISQIDTELQQRAIDDLVSTNQPISNFCGSLKNAKVGSFTEDEFGEAFEKSVDPQNEDPRIQAAKPALRYMLRLPTVTQLVSEIESADVENEQDLLGKAKFYKLAYSAFMEMKQHQTEIESALDRGYLYMGLNSLVAKKPELLNDPKVQGFCNLTETSMNQSSQLDFEREKKDFLNLLENAGLKASDIGFDPNYKTNVDLRLDKNALTMNGGWLEDLIKEDANDQDDAIDVVR